jgi:hypothetical protein
MAPQNYQGANAAATRGRLDFWFYRAKIFGCSLYDAEVDMIPPGQRAAMIVA